MTMREIQDMAIQRRSEMARVDAAIEDAFATYGEFPTALQEATEFSGFHIVAAPLGGPLSIDAPYQRQSLFERKPRVDASLRSGRHVSMDIFGCAIEPQNDFRPVLRGGRLIQTYRHQLNWEIVSVEVRESGVVALIFKTATYVRGISIRWIG